MKKLAFITAMILFATIAMAEIECQDYYFGIGVAQDYKKAFDCFQANSYKDYIALTVMYLNGEGTNRDLEKAREMWKLHTTEGGGDAYESAEMISFMKEIINSGKSKKRIDYGDLAQSTLDRNYWVSIQEVLRDQYLKELSSKIEDNLTDRIKKDFLEICKEIDLIASNDGDRTYMLYLDGSIRNQADTMTAVYIKRRHKKRLTNINDKILPPIKTADEYATADKQLNEEYKNAQKVGDEWLKEMDSPEKSEQTKELLKEFKDNYYADLKKAQQAWIKYRDAWVRFYMGVKPSLYKDDTEIKNSVSAWLTSDRIDELKFISGYNTEKVEIKAFSEDNF